MEDQCTEVAESFRDFLLGCCRIYNPVLRSERLEDSNSVSFGVISGLCGLGFELRKGNKISNRLWTEEEAKRAVRYSLLELNGLPDWLPALHENYPEIVESHFLREIMWELVEFSGEKPCHYTLDTLVCHGEWFRGKLGKHIFEAINKNEPKSSDVLRKCLKIIQDSDDVNKKELEELALQKVNQHRDSYTGPIWHSVYVSINPKDSIPYLERVLETIKDSSKATDFAMQFIVELVGGRRNTPSNTGESYKQPIYLERLYVLIHKYERISDDINRSGGGAYLPNLRDDAQDARSALFTMLTEIPGKETFQAFSALECIAAITQLIPNRLM